jgi:hypothetical protein
MNAESLVAFYLRTIVLRAAAELNRRKMASATGGKWHTVTVIRLRKRIANEEEAP